MHSYTLHRLQHQLTLILQTKTKHPASSDRPPASWGTNQNNSLQKSWHLPFWFYEWRWRWMDVDSQSQVLWLCSASFKEKEGGSSLDATDAAPAVLKMDTDVQNAKRRRWCFLACNMVLLFLWPHTQIILLSCSLHMMIHWLLGHSRWWHTRLELMIMWTCGPGQQRAKKDLAS